MTEPDWRSANRANWNEPVAIHLNAPCYELEFLRAGRGRLIRSRKRRSGHSRAFGCCICNATSVATV